MKVSFVIPLYNCLALTQATIASLRATLPAGLSYEIILVDDGSTDGTREWLAGLAAPFHVVRNERNLGYAGANNRGARIASGELLVLLNNDLLLTPRWLDPMLKVLDRLGSRAGVIGNVQLNAATGAVDHAGIGITLKAKPAHESELPPRVWRWLCRMRRVPAVTGACALVPRELWTQLGGFDEGFKNGGEDVDLCFRARAAGRINAVAHHSVIFHHVSSSPGRRQRDEENSRRLALRWRAELESLAWRRWCWDYLDREWRSPRQPIGHRDARAALAYGLHLRSTPPAIAQEGMRAAMDIELARWEKLLGP